jgi:hypothetical protein
VEDEADKGSADAAVGPDRPNDVPLDDILNAPALLAIVPSSPASALRTWRRGAPPPGTIIKINYGSIL